MEYTFGLDLYFGAHTQLCYFCFELTLVICHH